LTDWKFAQREPKDQLAHLHEFSMVKHCGSEQIEFRITVYEFVSPPDPGMPYYATADKELNQSTAPCRPFGWGRSLLEALANCVDQIRRFPYEPAD
jgi:hypothetical protein